MNHTLKRGALRTLAIALLACSTEGTQASSAALSPSQSAISLLQSLQSAFVLRYDEAPTPRGHFKGNDKPTAATRVVLRPSRVKQVQQSISRLVPDFGGAVVKVTTTMPVQANGSVELSVDGVSVRASLVGASASGAELAEGYVVYPNGAGAGHVLLRPSPEGIEDYITFQSAPQNPSVTYTLELGSGLAGLRLVGGTLEMLDSSGAPRLRVRRPYLVGSDGKATLADLSVAGCAVDTSPRAPWGRSVTTPGSSTCTLKVSWNNGTVTYPAILDPSWSWTGSMSEARAEHTATVLDSGQVLVTCGHNAGVPPGAELYDPVSGTWAITEAPWTRRTYHTATKLPDGNVLIAGGVSTSTWVGLQDAELYDPLAAPGCRRGA